MADSKQPPRWNPFSQCAWCGSNNRSGTIGYGGERTCPTCGWGGDGEPDVPCMFYKVATRSPLTGAAKRDQW
jgi:hypothetical protein